MLAMRSGESEQIASQSLSTTFSNVAKTWL